MVGLIIVNIFISNIYHNLEPDGVTAIRHLYFGGYDMNTKEITVLMAHL